MPKLCPSCKAYQIGNGMSACEKCKKMNRKQCFNCKLYIIPPESLDKICKECNDKNYKQCVGEECNVKILKYGKFKNIIYCIECQNKFYLEQMKRKREQRRKERELKIEQRRLDRRQKRLEIHSRHII